VTEYLGIFFQAYMMMSLTGANVKLISRSQYTVAFFVSVVISLLWWQNSTSAAHTHLALARYVYAVGAGFGTITGMWIVKRFTNGNS
jgi:uncharacterized membrane protein YfcA